MADFVPLPPPPPPPPPPHNWRGQGQRPQHQQWNNNRGKGRGRGRGQGGGRNWNRGEGGRSRGRGRGGNPNRGQGNPRSHRELSYNILEEIGTSSESSLCVAVQGCCHGELDAIYDSLKSHEERTGKKVDVLLCCGDFQSLRNTADYHSLAVPIKYRSLGSFCRYYSKEKVAPVLTIFIGGNHEASQSLQELSYGGWVAPNIYYLGAAGVVRVGGIRIGGISGIYKSHDYVQGKFERPPYDRSSLRSIYHVRNMDVFRVKCLSPDDRVDIMLSHDWPQGIEQHGNTADLLRRKPYFRSEVERNDLGSPANYELLQELKPKWWFSAHLHVKFKATVRHSTEASEANEALSNNAYSELLVPAQLKQHSTKRIEKKCIIGAPPELDKNSLAGDDEDAAEQTKTTQFHSIESSEAQCAGVTSLTDQMTQFLSLDKCLPRRDFLSIVHVPRKETEIGTPIQLEYDVEWLAILKKTHHLTVPQRRRVYVPNDVLQVTEEEMKWVESRLVQQRPEPRDESKPTASSLVIPDNFCQNVPPHDDPSFANCSPPPFAMMGNPQTDQILNLLDVGHIVTVPFANISQKCEFGNLVDGNLQTGDDNEINLDDDDDDDEGEGDKSPIESAKKGPLDTEKSESSCVVDEDEIDLEEEDGGSLLLVKRARIDT